MRMKNLRVLLIAFIVGGIVTACGTVATPAWQTPEDTHGAAGHEEAAAVDHEEADAHAEDTTDEHEEAAEQHEEATEAPTATPEPPTETPEPPTATPEPPTETPEPEANVPENIGNGDVANGEALFSTIREGAGLACIQCHLVDTEETLIGPGLANIANVAADRAGDDAAGYLYGVLTEHHTLSGEDHTPYTEAFSEEELNDIVTYLLSLDEEEAATNENPDTPAESSPEVAGDPAQGEIWFNTVPEGAGLACSSCHHVDSDDMLVGPGLLSIAERAATRVEGLSAEEYIVQSITHPDDYVVEGYPPSVMPQNYAEIWTEEQLQDIVAYLLSLGE
ncbi:MAG: hypothetical protein D6712_03020 [Chloroflexi bacterium]|nr:MAG: hypothetical protein D6712_03020 [Chloroflexota bacterium]